MLDKAAQNSSPNSLASSLAIRKFADHFGVTPRTIRFYEAKGLLSPSREGGGRVFGRGDVVRFEKIMRAKRLGFTLDEIKEVLEITDGSIYDAVELQRRKKKFEAGMANLERQREDIDIVMRDMSEICALITDQLSKTAQSNGVSHLADAYEAKFRQTMDDDYEMKDDYKVT